MSLAAPKIDPGAQAAPPAAQGATALQLGGVDGIGTSRTQGAVGRLALRVGTTTPLTPPPSSVPSNIGS